MYKHRKEVYSDLTPQEAFEYLKEGNDRFKNNLKKNTNHLEQVNETKDGQFPFASFLACADSRVPVELLFDQGLGDVFTVRLAGNIASNYAIASLEFAAKYLGSKLIVILGHTSCGAVKGTCDDLEDGMLHNIFELIKPAVDEEKTVTENRTSSNVDYVEKVTELNVYVQRKRVLQESNTLKQLVADKKVGIVCAVYDVENGSVKFLENNMFDLN
jgi:carbonic anhydrase